MQNLAPVSCRQAMFMAGFWLFAYLHLLSVDDDELTDLAESIMEDCDGEVLCAAVLTYIMLESFSTMNGDDDTNANETIQIIAEQVVWNPDMTVQIKAVWGLIEYNVYLVLAVVSCFQLEELERCPDCYMRSNTREKNWFTKPCVSR